MIRRPVLKLYFSVSELNLDFIFLGCHAQGLAPIQCTPRLTSRAYTGALALKLDLGFYALSLLLAIKISQTATPSTPLLLLHGRLFFFFSVLNSDKVSKPETQTMGRDEEVFSCFWQ